jgi:hypothetical protein
MVEKDRNGLRKAAQFLRSEERFMNTIGTSIMALAGLKQS